MSMIVHADRLPIWYWFIVPPTGIIASLIIGIPTAVIPNPLFTRMTPTRPLDYAFWIVSSILLGFLGATYFVQRQEQADETQNKMVGGGLLSVLAVGCPICNKLVVLVLGLSGALTYFAPVQPAIGLVSVVLLAYALRVRFQRLNGACPVR